MKNPRWLEEQFKNSETTKQVLFFKMFVTKLITTPFRDKRKRPVPPFLKKYWMTGVMLHAFNKCLYRAYKYLLKWLDKLETPDMVDIRAIRFHINAIANITRLAQPSITCDCFLMDPHCENCKGKGWLSERDLVLRSYEAAQLSRSSSGRSRQKESVNTSNSQTEES